MEKKNKIILAAIVAVAVIAIIVAAMVSTAPENKKSAVVDGTKTTQSTDPTPEPEKVTPTFVYFITKEDAETDAFLATVEKLKGEFEGKINFDLRDLDANPEEKENFALVVGNTPAVIMLDIYNNPCAFDLSNPSEDALRATIAKALGE